MRIRRHAIFQYIKEEHFICVREPLGTVAQMDASEALKVIKWILRCLRRLPENEMLFTGLTDKAKLVNIKGIPYFAVLWVSSVLHSDLF